MVDNVTKFDLVHKLFASCTGGKEARALSIQYISCAFIGPDFGNTNFIWLYHTSELLQIIC